MEIVQVYRFCPGSLAGKLSHGWLGFRSLVFRANTVARFLTKRAIHSFFHKERIALVFKQRKERSLILL